MTSDDHAHYSSLREKVLDHLFIGELLRELWVQKRRVVEVLRPEVDRGGYDLAIQYGAVLRHIQLKSSHTGVQPRPLNISMELANKPSGCVVCIRFDERSLELKQYLWLGGEPGMPLPRLDTFKTARRTTRGRGGQYVLRDGIRVVPVNQFRKLKDVSEVLQRLFGR